jgi:ribosomal protein L37AE/L43A
MELIDNYISILKKYNLEEHITISEKKDKNSIKKYKCQICNNTDFEIIDTRIYICHSCGYQIENIGTSMSYHDVSRVNMSSKYTYERRVHFRDCINQYQGKQNSTINDKVYKELEEQFRLHGLLVESDDPKEVFKNITKDNILLFLKELGYTRHYEDLFLIHYKLTDKLPDNISHLEQKLMDDFDILSSLYDQKFKQTKRVDRKNFINTQYVLYQLLRKYKHPCKKEDFNILKTLDRKSFHDEICLELFTELGWNFTPFF